MSDLYGEDIGREQLVDPLPKFIADPDGLDVVDLGQYPFQRHIGIEDVSHPSSRVSRIRGTARSTLPTRCRISSRIRSMRSAARRIASGSRTPLRTRSTAA